MRFSEDFLAELHARTDIEELVGKYTEINHAGSKTPVALCPFHTERTPSFVIYRDTQSYYCFGCGAGGDAITFIKNIEHLDYVEAVRFLCERAGMNMPLEPVDDEYNRMRRRCFEANREAAKFFHRALYSEIGRRAKEYLIERGVKSETIKRFGLGYAPESWDALVKRLKGKNFSETELLSFDLAKKTQSGSAIDSFRNRLIFPIIDLRGNVIAFGGRSLDETKPKYLNTSDTVVYKKSNALYALNFAKNSNDRKLILCEGYMDVIALHQAGFTNAVAGLGTSFTNEQVSLLIRYCDELTLCFDSDEAGIKATKRALKMLSKSSLKLKVMFLTGGKDPDEIIKNQGREKMKKIINSAVNDTEFALINIKQRYDVSTENGKLGFLNEAVSALADVSNDIELDIYISKLASELEVEKSAIVSQLEKQKKNKKRRFQEEQFNSALKNILGEKNPYLPNSERQRNVKAVKAEEIILASLLKNPDYIKKLSGILTPDIFVTDFNRKYFMDIYSRISSGKSLELFSIGENAENDEMAYLSYLLSKGDELSNSVAECEQCIKTLIQEKDRKKISEIGQLSAEEYLELFRKKRSKNKQTKGV